jgi:hypothetical protein
MKKYLALFLVVVMLFSLPACGNKNADDSGVTDSKGSGGQSSSQGPTGSSAGSKTETSAGGSVIQESADEGKAAGKDTASVVAGDSPSAAEIAGFYLGRSWDPDDPDDDDDEDFSSDATIAIRPDGGLRMVDEDDDNLNLDYDPQTDTYSLVSNFGDVSVRMELKFSYQGSGIHLSGSMWTDYGEMRLELDKQ